MDLPDFMIIGAQRCGTTTMHDLLVQHPMISRPTTKETHFFDVHNKFNGRGLRFYSQFFNRKKDYLIFESTPSYIVFPEIPKKIKALVPGCKKFIVLLREPSERAWSAYLFFKAYRWNNIPFWKFIDDELKYWNTEKDPWNPQLQDTIPPNRLLLKNMLLKRGQYSEQLENWYKVFPDKNMLLIIKSEDFFEDTRGTMEIIESFLDIPKTTYMTNKRYVNKNSSFYRNQMNQKTREWLKRYFEPWNEKLYKLTGISWE